MHPQTTQTGLQMPQMPQSSSGSGPCSGCQAPAPKVENDAAIAAVANVKQTAQATVLSFKEPINFKYNSDALDAKSTSTVDQVAAALKKYPNAKVRVAGYTDSLGNAAYNMDLSERRAHSVAERLVQDLRCRTPRTRRHPGC